MQPMNESGVLARGQDEILRPPRIRARVKTGSGETQPRADRLLRAFLQNLEHGAVEFMAVPILVLDVGPLAV